MLASGVLIDERYKVDQLAGRGGMAEVFRATDLTSGELVALKLLRSVEPPNVRRFQAEVEVLSRLCHPGVVKLCGTGTHDDIPYLVLELVDGPSLADQLAVGPLAVDRTIAVGEQLAAALAYAHGRGVVHRDVKPSNVLFDASGRVRLADFGIAHLADSTRMTASGRCVGTAAYLAPEQLDGRVGPAADVYALGLVLIECLTGTPCYPGGLIEAAMARLHRSPGIPEGLPEWLRTVLAAMTARDPARRPSAATVAEAMERRSADAVVPVVVAVAVTAEAPGDRSGLAFQDVTAVDTAAVLPLHQTPGRDRHGHGVTLARVPATVAAAFAVLAVSVTMWLVNEDGSPEAKTPRTPATPVDQTPTVSTTAPPTTASDPAPVSVAASGEEPTSAQTPPAVVGDDGVPPTEEEDDDADDDDGSSGNGNANGRGRGRGGGGNGHADD